MAALCPGFLHVYRMNVTSGYDYCIFISPTNENLMNLIKKLITLEVAQPKVVDTALMIAIFTMTVIFKANKMMPFFLD